jgi:predicted transcriptional regulator
MTLKEYLADQGLTESAFAEMLGISQAAVNRYCNGIRTPQRITLRAIAKATAGKVTANDFMGAE